MNSSRAMSPRRVAEFMSTCGISMRAALVTSGAWVRDRTLRGWAMAMAMMGSATVSGSGGLAVVASAQS
ncbi:hypothetical protein BCR44DRAFT_1443560 [Catenaria anguillulae PL171]|uniref:Uncharacterized protein n=1 Tax=Catenaria anguillulae PL171 TaxID=765915 RepID=A0A1Y2HD29_9FUNG|nr:hypothetical protein BCR44DRAFT_1443560 [Catenaria anguillulae PL171]